MDGYFTWGVCYVCLNMNGMLSACMMTFCLLTLLLACVLCVVSSFALIINLVDVSRCENP